MAGSVFRQAEKLKNERKMHGDEEEAAMDPGDDDPREGDRASNAVPCCTRILRNPDANDLYDCR